MPFDLKLLPKQKLNVIENTEGRFYEAPNGALLPSVTTVLSKHYPFDYDSWARRVGADKAKRISTQAKRRGTALHRIMENYVLGHDHTTGEMPINVATFKSVQPIIDEHVSTVYSCEHPLYSYDLKTAGCTDLICSWKNKNAIVDYKTSKKLKEEKYIENYFVQSMMYALMANELFDLDISTIAVIIAVDNEQPQIFEKTIDSFWKEKIMSIVEPHS